MCIHLKSEEMSVEITLFATIATQLYFFNSISLYTGNKDQQLTPIDYERIE